MDNYYLNNAVYLAEEFLQATKEPYYDGEVLRPRRDKRRPRRSTISDMVALLLLTLLQAAPAPAQPTPAQTAQAPRPLNWWSIPPPVALPSRTWTRLRSCPRTES